MRWSLLFGSLFQVNKISMHSQTRRVCDAAVSDPNLTLSPASSVLSLCCAGLHAPLAFLCSALGPRGARLWTPLRLGLTASLLSITFKNLIPSHGNSSIFRYFVANQVGRQYLTVLICISLISSESEDLYYPSSIFHCMDCLSYQS